MKTLYRARWVLPVARPPIEHGWVLVEDARVAAVGSDADGVPEAAAAETVDGVILPGLVNAHTHLELSWMRDQVPPAPAMPQWVERLMALRRTVGHEPEEPIREAVLEVRASGTALVGDITNTFAAYEPLADSELSAAIFRELLGFAVDDPEVPIRAAQEQMQALTPMAWLRPSIVPHAPYSVSPALLRAIGEAAGDAPLSIHLAESAEEVEFLERGEGAWRDLLTRLGVWSESWRAPGVRPVDYIASLGLLTPRLIAVHCVQLTDEELRRLAAAGATVVTCPRSNRWTGAGLPPVGRFYASGVRVAIGTDSLASVEDLNLFAELALIRELAPDVPACALIESATRHGADALGFGGELGTIERGKRAELIAVTLPAHVDDVEEYLVAGVAPRNVRWLGVL
ncbi:MAG TPA: amidohydrolase family protein [Vicinamibacterales bacterium]|nr:amidohydrolase family protein [Vicinamibacterales bacterium]